jgi:DNA-binding NarL/FixJ family response regulator
MSLSSGLNNAEVFLNKVSVRVLVVDDFEPWRRSVRLLLQQADLQVIGEVSDGLEAVQKAEELQPDLVLMDIGLPTLNGIEAANRIHRIVPKAKILFLTQNNDPEVVSAALLNGARGYVLKMDAKSELLAAIETVIRGGMFVSRRLERPNPG